MFEGTLWSIKLVFHNSAAKRKWCEIFTVVSLGKPNGKHFNIESYSVCFFVTSNNKKRHMQLLWYDVDDIQHFIIYCENAQSIGVTYSTGENT